MKFFEFGLDSNAIERRRWPVTRQLVHFIFSIFDDEEDKSSKDKSWFSPLRLIK